MKEVVINKYKLNLVRKLYIFFINKSLHYIYISEDFW